MKHYSAVKSTLSIVSFVSRLEGSPTVITILSGSTASCLRRGSEGSSTDRDEFDRVPRLDGLNGIPGIDGPDKRVLTLHSNDVRDSRYIQFGCHSWNEAL